MTVRNLEYLLKPSSIALIGASRRAKSIGAVVAKNLFNAGFDGPIMPVNPRERSIEGVLCYNSVDDLPIAPDLGIICTPPDTVPDLVDQLGRRGTKAAIVITAGFGELGAEGLGRCSRRCWMRPGRTCCASAARTAWVSWCPIAASTPASSMSIR